MEVTLDSRLFDRLSVSLATRITRRSAVRNLGLAGTSVLAFGVLGIRSSGAAQQEGLPPAWFRTSQSCRDDATCGRHTQVIFGAGPVYASHLPLFMFDSPGNHPHHYQVITEVTLRLIRIDKYRTIWENHQTHYRSMDEFIAGTKPIFTSG